MLHPSTLLQQSHLFNSANPIPESNPQSCNMTSCQRRVHFLPENDAVSHVEIVKDFTTEQEAVNVWYSSSELSNMALNSFREALQADSGNETSDIDIRGLESCTKQGKELHDNAIRQCIDAVMDEQEAQWSDEQDDYEKLAAVCQEASTPSMVLALERAKEDEKEAQRIYKSIQTPNSSESKQCQSRRRSLSKSNVGSDDDTSACSDLSQYELFAVNLTEQSSGAIEVTSMNEPQDHSSSNVQATFTHHNFYAPIWIGGLIASSFILLFHIGCQNGWELADTISRLEL